MARWAVRCICRRRIVLLFGMQRSCITSGTSLLTPTGSVTPPCRPSTILSFKWCTLIRLNTYSRLLVERESYFPLLSVWNPPLPHTWPVIFLKPWYITALKLSKVTWKRWELQAATRNGWRRTILVFKLPIASSLFPLLSSLIELLLIWFCKAIASLRPSWKTSTGWQGRDVFLGLLSGEKKRIIICSTSFLRLWGKSRESKILKDIPPSGAWTDWSSWGIKVDGSYWLSGIRQLLLCTKVQTKTCLVFWFSQLEVTEVWQSTCCRGADRYCSRKRLWYLVLNWGYFARGRRWTSSNKNEWWLFLILYLFV